MDQTFDVILTNPPFQDRQRRGKTRHKIWIDFTHTVFERLLSDNGLLCQVSPASFRSPSNTILELFRHHHVHWINLDTGQYFPGIGSTFADYAISKSPSSSVDTKITDEKGYTSSVRLDASVFYLPTDLTEEGLNVHAKVMFAGHEPLPVDRDYVTCHNIKRRTTKTLSKTRTKQHVYPVLHTNRQTWWSSLEQDIARKQKVMWSRSGYTKPFFDDGKLGATDMVYFVLVPSASAGKNLAHNLNTRLFRYIYSTAKWSGFGNEKVFAALPRVPYDQPLSDQQMYELFGLTSKEARHVDQFVG